MGVYYAVANHTKKEYLYDPCDRGVKWGALWDYRYPMSRLFLYKIWTGWSCDKIQIVDDHWFPWDYEDGWNDITKEAVEDYLRVFDDPKDKSDVYGFGEDNMNLHEYEMNDAERHAFKVHLSEIEYTLFSREEAEAHAKMTELYKKYNEMVAERISRRALLDLIENKAPGLKDHELIKGIGSFELEKVRQLVEAIVNGTRINS